ncbi:MAG: ATP-binding protein [Bacteroidota bacterium]
MTKKELDQILVKIGTDSQFGVIITDFYGKIEWANRRIESMTGYSLEEMRGNRPGYLLQGPDTSEEHVEYIRNGLRSQEFFETEILNYAKSGRKFWVNLQISPVKNVRNEVKFFVGIQHDITDLKDQNEQLENFNYLTTHNFVNQVGNLYNLISLLPSKGMDNGEFKIIELLRLSSRKLKATTIDLRKMLNFIGKERELYYEEVYFEEVLAGVVEMLRSDLNEGQVNLDVEVATGIRLNINKIYLESIMQNLLSNAIKYRDPEKEPCISIKASQNEKEIICSFSDNGLGIDTEKGHKAIFQAFKTYHENPEAIGIGLYLTKKQVEKLGGSVDVSSELGAGSTFTIKIPN